MRNPVLIMQHDSSHRVGHECPPATMNNEHTTAWHHKLGTSPCSSPPRSPCVADLFQGFPTTGACGTHQLAWMPLRGAVGAAMAEGKATYALIKARLNAGLWTRTETRHPPSRMGGNRACQAYYLVR